MRRIFILILTNIKLNIFLAKSSQMTGKSVPVILATFLIWSYETNLLDNIYLVWLQVCSLRGPGPDVRKSKMDHKIWQFACGGQRTGRFVKNLQSSSRNRTSRVGWTVYPSPDTAIHNLLHYPLYSFVMVSLRRNE